MFFGRQNRIPHCLAATRPAEVRSRIKSRSNSGIPANTVMIILLDHFIPIVELEKFLCDILNLQVLSGPYLLTNLDIFYLLGLRSQNIDDAFIQPYSGHAKRDSLEIYSKLSLADTQDKYNDVIGDFPI